MSMNEPQKQTNANIQAKANLIREIATHRVTVHKTGFTKQELWQLPCEGC